MRGGRGHDAGARAAGDGRLAGTARGGERRSFTAAAASEASPASLLGGVTAPARSSRSFSGECVDWRVHGAQGSARVARPARSCAWAWLLALLAALLRCCAAQELDLTFAYSTLDQDYLPITPRPRPGVAHDYDYTSYASALPFYGMPASVGALEARCADARNACPLNVTGGSEAALLPLPLAGVYEPVACFTAHTMYSRRVSAADAARGWAGPPEYLLYFSQALDVATQLEPAWYFSRLYVAFSYEYLARLRVGPTGYARARQPQWGAAAASGAWDVCATFVRGANASGGGDTGRCTSFRTGNAADASRWRPAPSLRVACVDGWQEGAAAVTPLGEACDAAHAACALAGNATPALAGRFEPAGCQSQRPVYSRHADGAAVYFDTDAGAWLACGPGGATCGAASALAALLAVPPPGAAPGGPAFAFPGATSAVVVPTRPDAVPPGWAWAVPSPPGTAADVALALWPAAGARGFTFLAPGLGFACVANGTAAAAAPPPPPPPPAAHMVHATLRLDGALTVRSFRTPQRAALCAVAAAGLGLPPRAASITGAANISTPGGAAGTGRRRLRAAPSTQAELCGVDVQIAIATPSPLDAADVAAALARLTRGGEAGPLARAIAAVLPAVTSVTLLQVMPPLPPPAPATSYLVLAACIGTLLPAAAAALAAALLLQRRDARRRKAAGAAAVEFRDAMMSAFPAVSSADFYAQAPAMLPFDHWRALGSGGATTGVTLSFAPISGVAVVAAARSGGGAEVAPVAPLQFGAQDVVPGAALGSGRFGVAYRASWLGTPVCVKAWHPACSAPGGAADVAALQAQMARLSRLRHPNITSVYGFCIEADAPPMLLLELGARGSLAELLRSDAATSLGWRERARLALGVACGLAYLHAQEPPIVHLDVKCENVVLDDGLTPKLGDFGLALFHAAAAGTGGAEAAEPEAMSVRDAARLCATPLHAAPELSEEAATAPLPRPLALDVYSFAAAVLHALAHRHRDRFETPLYRHIMAPDAAPNDAAAPGGWTPVQVLVARCLAGWLPELTDECPPPLADVIRRCCAVDSAARPRMDALRDELAALLDTADAW